MDENPLVRLEFSQVLQGMPNREETNGQRRRFFQVQLRRFQGDEIGRRYYEPCETGRGQCDNRVARFEPLNTGSDGHDFARALAAQRSRIAGIKVQDIEHVAKVQSGGVDFDFHLAGQRRLARRPVARPRCPIGRAK